MRTIRFVLKCFENIGPSNTTFPCPALVIAVLMSNRNKSSFHFIQQFRSRQLLPEPKQANAKSRPAARLPLERGPPPWRVPPTRRQKCRIGDRRSSHRSVRLSGWPDRSAPFVQFVIS